MRLMNPEDFMKRYRAALEHAADGEDAVKLALADTPTIDDSEVITLVNLEDFISDLKERSGLDCCPGVMKDFEDEWEEETGEPPSNGVCEVYADGYVKATFSAFTFVEDEIEDSVADYTGVWELDPQCQEYIGSQE